VEHMIDTQRLLGEIIGMGRRSLRPREEPEEDGATLKRLLYPPIALLHSRI
jgi:hypothetical protein